MPCPGFIGRVGQLPNGTCVQTYCVSPFGGGTPLLPVPCVTNNCGSAAIMCPMVSGGARTPCQAQNLSPLPDPGCGISEDFVPNNNNLADPVSCSNTPRQ